VPVPSVGVARPFRNVLQNPQTTGIPDVAERLQYCLTIISFSLHVPPIYWFELSKPTCNVPKKREAAQRAVKRNENQTMTRCRKKE